jgi:CheY-like chemotaxis protein
MPGVDGLEATRRIVASGNATRIIVLTTYDVDEFVFAYRSASSARRRVRARERPWERTARTQRNTPVCPSE